MVSKSPFFPGFFPLTSRIDQKVSNSPYGYKLQEAQAILSEVRSIRDAISSGEKEKQELMQVSCWSGTKNMPLFFFASLWFDLERFASLDVFSDDLFWGEKDLVLFVGETQPRLRGRRREESPLCCRSQICPLSSHLHVTARSACEPANAAK